MPRQIRRFGGEYLAETTAFVGKRLGAAVRQGLPRRNAGYFGVRIARSRLGRYWEVGPQKTLFVPAGALKEGKNELILFETDGLKGAPEIEFVAAADLG